MSDNIKWPKMFPELTEEQKWINNDFMHYWHTILPKQYSFIENFNNNYVIKNKPVNFIKTLEIGAGLGEHLTKLYLINSEKIMLLWNYVRIWLNK